MEKMISIVGCGPGGAGYITPIVSEIIHNADVFIAAPHLQALFMDITCQRYTVSADIERILQVIAANRHRTIVVGVSGDPGIASLSRNIIDRFGKDNCRVVPGISSISVAFARLGLDWTNARIVNAHRGIPPDDPTLARAPILAILAGTGTVAWVKNYCDENQGIKTIYICENVTLPDEKIRVLSNHDELPGNISSHTIIILTKED